jgi:hypothetical protein
MRTITEQNLDTIDTSTPRTYQLGLLSWLDDPNGDSDLSTFFLDLTNDLHRAYGNRRHPSHLLQTRILRVSWLDATFTFTLPANCPITELEVFDPNMGADWDSFTLRLLED